MPLVPADVLAAADRLRGQVVATPLIGGIVLPGMEHVRIKPEILQPGGSIWFRGYLHWLLRQMGALKGLVVDPALGARPAFAAVVAAKWLRVPCVVALGAEPDQDSAAPHADLQRWVRAIDLVPSLSKLRAADAARQLGFRLSPSREQPDVQCGIATVGVELAREAPEEVELFGIAPASLDGALHVGLRAGNRAATVTGVEVVWDGEPELRTHSEILRLQFSQESLAALACTGSKVVPAVAVLAE